ncbi:MAG: hypothetical protein COV43_05250 [Deltaproteobacteria bacterium CG11_big_fil_rev_8_21_14_0_20_42_23]|nr:MAG: hypothetical protein COV43_05250 [Deltaproteobacteria bacterium CG11_big_fil_rev_8_21_14_0_20_42_23]PJC64000.1 MAG: hypothetical protein CO021_06215 [Deltaproteobacteria bacterium CG_4_9_14_0_2_um_filter_42_21]
MKPKHLSFLLFFFICIFSASAFAYGNTATKTEPQNNEMLRKHMSHMASEWVNLEILSSSAEINYKEVAKTLKKMKNTAQIISKMNKNTKLESPIISLISQMETMQKHLKNKSPELLHQDLDFLSQTCFACHQAHANP